jgi:F-type H+-transporting ATPase subunit c
MAGTTNTVGTPTRMQRVTLTEAAFRYSVPFAAVEEDRGVVAGENKDGTADKRIPMKKMQMFLTLFAGAMLASLASAPLALAAEGGEGVGGAAGLIGLGAGLAIGAAAFGCGMGQGRAVAAAMESIGRNPNSADRLQTPMIIGLAMIESLGIYALVIAFFLQGKIG